MLLDDIEKWATKQPDATALFTETRLVNYADLLGQAHVIADALNQHGVRPGDRVALLLPKGALAVACVLGILLAGAAYVPLDPRTPAPRTAQILDVCSPRVLIGSSRFIERVALSAPELVSNVLKLVTDPSDDFEPAFCRSAAPVALPRPASPYTPNAPAYILFTSGSTGQPKGVVVSHRAAYGFVDWARRTFSLGPTDRLTSFAPLSFDLSIFDIFGALCSGAAVLFLAPELLLRPKELVERLKQWQATTLYAVPSTIALLEREGELSSAKVTTLRQVLYAGEPFPIPQLILAMAAAPQATFYNLFGPTETNVCTYYPIPQTPPSDAEQVPIGYACDHLKVDLLDDDGNPVAAGQQGELCVAGPSVMTEYWGDPHSTCAAFHPGERFADGLPRYRTGDRAVADQLGRFWFCGRRDRLVKRRGYRIELGDVEASLRRHPEVRQAAAVAIALEGETRIRAFVSLRIGAGLSPLILRAHCGSLLPPYMVPDSIDIMDELPLTLTGKVDLQLLRQQGQHS